MHTFESKLSKENFFKRVMDLEPENVLILGEPYNGGTKETPAGFIMDETRVMVFMDCRNRVWVAMGKSNPKKSRAVIEHLELEPRESYPFALEHPCEEIMDAWRKR